MKVVCAEQRVPEWYQARVGKLTGSSAADMLAKHTTKGEAARRSDLRLRLALERITGDSQEDGGFISDAMQWGMDKEPDAVAAYESVTGTLVQRVGFLAHDALEAGCSPDGYIGNYDGLLEVKCPKSTTHLRYLRANVAPADYLPQMYHALWITGARWCDFVSFDPRFPSPLQFFRVRVTRVEHEIQSYELMARAFLTEVEKEIAAVVGMAGAAA